MMDEHPMFPMTMLPALLKKVRRRQLTKPSVPVKITEDKKADHKIDIVYIDAGRPLEEDAWMSKMIACWTHAMFPGCDTVLVIG